MKSLALAAATTALMLLGSIQEASAATATLTLNPTHELPSTAGNYFDATFRVDTCFLGVTARLFWYPTAAVGAVVDPPCASPTSMVIFFGHVSGPGPAPGDSTYTAMLCADSDLLCLHAYVSAQAVFHMDTPPPPPYVPPSNIPPVTPPSGAPAAVNPPPPSAPVAPPPASPAAASPSPGDTLCPSPAAFIGRPGPTGGMTPAGIVGLIVLLCGAGALLLRARRRRVATFLVLLLLAVAITSCGRWPPGGGVSANLSPTPAQTSGGASPSPTC